MCPSVDKPGHVRSELDSQHYKQTAEGCLLSRAFTEQGFICMSTHPFPTCLFCGQPLRSPSLEPYLLEFTT